jgi:hypothetical protein
MPPIQRLAQRAQLGFHLSDLVASYYTFSITDDQSASLHIEELQASDRDRSQLGPFHVQRKCETLGTLRVHKKPPDSTP